MNPRYNKRRIIQLLGNGERMFKIQLWEMKSKTKFPLIQNRNFVRSLFWKKEKQWIFPVCMYIFIRVKTKQSISLGEVNLTLCLLWMLLGFLTSKPEAGLVVRAELDIKVIVFSRTQFWHHIIVITAALFTIALTSSAQQYAGLLKPKTNCDTSFCSTKEVP